MKRLSFIAIVAAVLAMVGCQKGTGEPVLKLSTNTLEVPAAGGDCSVIVTSNVEYVVNQTNKQDTWVRMLGYTESGKDMITYNFRISKNTSEEERSSEVTFIGGGVTPQRLMIVQAGVPSQGGNGGNDDGGNDDGGNDDGGNDDGGNDDGGNDDGGNDDGGNDDGGNDDGGNDDGGDEPVTPPAPVLEASVSASALSATATQTSVSFSLSLNIEAAWTATSNNSAFTVSPASGNTSQTITVSFAANTSTSAKTAVITVEVEDKEFTVTVTQAGNNIQYFTTTGVIAKWTVTPKTTVSTWDDATDVDWGKNKTGDCGRYMDATSGNGVKNQSQIRYVATDRSSYVLSDNASHDPRFFLYHAPSSNKYGRLMVYSHVPGDMWTYTAKTDKQIAPGSTLKFYTYMGASSAVSERWIIEYKDGNEWKPVKATTTDTESATTESFTGTAVSYSKSVTYNHKFTDSTRAFESTFTISNATDKIEIRMYAVGMVANNGKKVSKTLGKQCEVFLGYTTTDGVASYPYISLVSAGN